MKWNRYRLAIFSAPAVGAIFFTFILTQSHHDAGITDGIVTVVAGEPDGAGAHPAPAKSDVANPAISNEPADTGTTPPIFAGPVRQLHDSIAAEEEDQRWAADVKREVADVVGRVPYISSDHPIRCGTIRCELSITMQPGISVDNASYVTSRFYSLPDTGQAHQIQVEGVFPSEAAPGSPRTLTVIYMRDAG